MAKKCALSHKEEKKAKFRCDPYLEHVMKVVQKLVPFVLFCGLSVNCETHVYIKPVLLGSLNIIS